ncbi:hypothetical protein KJ885_00485 [Patescibacteria group bacterium]|nr:hypothetical protein [Patescibacteria group bacterium]
MNILKKLFEKVKSRREEWIDKRTKEAATKIAGVIRDALAKKIEEFENSPKGREIKRRQEEIDRRQKELEEKIEKVKVIVERRKKEREEKENAK